MDIQIVFIHVQIHNFLSTLQFKCTKSKEKYREWKNPTAVLIAALQPGKKFRQLYKMQ